MSPTQREIMLDLAVSAEGFTRLDTSWGRRSEGPDHIPEDAHSFDLILDDGSRADRLFEEDVQWWRVLAWKCEDALGNPLDPDDDDLDGDYGEPEPLDTDHVCGDDTCGKGEG
jgi:hypothetical protein